MQVFKAFFLVLKKHIKPLFIYTGIYAFLLLLITGTAEDNLNGYFESASLDISVIDRDHSQTGKALIEYLDSRHNLIEIEDTKKDIQDHIYYRYVKYILIIPEGFEKNLIQGKMEGLLQHVQIPGSSQGRFLNNQIDNFVKETQIYLAGGLEITDAIEAVQKTLADPLVETLHFEEKKESGNDGIFYFFQYLPYIYILLLVCGLAPILFALNKKEIYERTLCSSMRLMQKNLQILLGSVCYSILTYIVFVALGFLLMGKDMIRAETFCLLLNSAVFLMFAAAMTILLCTLCPVNDSVLNFIANTVGLGMSFLCGVFVPQSLLSKPVLVVAKFLPAYWYIKNNNMLAGFSEEPFSQESFFTAVGIQALFAAVMFTGVLAVSKLKRQRR